MLFYVYSAFYINIEYNVLASFQLFLNLCFQCTIKPVFVYFFVFQKLSFINLCPKLLWR